MRVAPVRRRIDSTYESKQMQIVPVSERVAGGAGALCCDIVCSCQAPSASSSVYMRHVGVDVLDHDAASDFLCAGLLCLLRGFFAMAFVLVSSSLHYFL